MRTQNIVFLLAIFASALACQFLFPVRTGTLITNCAEIVSAVAAMQAGDIPNHLMETGIKQGNEFDVNQYFDVLTHLSLRESFALDYVYQNDDLGGYPLLYVRPVDQAPYASAADIPDNTQLPDLHDYVEVKDTEQGYFEYVVLDIMADQFYLFWHANYNDYEIVCARDEVNDIVETMSSGDFGNPMNLAQQTKARGMRNIEPSVALTGEVATVQFITFTKWGVFYRETYTINRSFPHTITDIKQQNLVPYDCGVAF